MNGYRPQKPKRKYLANEFSELADLVIECAKSLKKTCETINNPNEILDAIKKVYQAESRGDDIRDRLIKSFSLEKHPPVIQLDRVGLLHHLDKIMNKTEHAARQIQLCYLFFPVEELPALVEIADIVLTTAMRVAESTKIVFYSFEEAVDKIKDIEDFRDKSRDKTFELQVRVLKNPKTTHQNMFAVEKISYRVQQVSERAKQAADLIEIMKLKYL